MDATEEYFSIETQYSIHYNTKDPVPIKDIINSLRSFEKIIQRTPAFIEHALGDELKVVDVKVYIDELKSGSLTEDFLIKFIFKGQDNYEKAKEVFDKMLEDNTMLRTAVAVGVGALIAYGAMTAIGPAGEKNHFEAYNSTIINVGQRANFTAGDIVSIIDSTKDKKSLAREAIEAIHPAKADPESTIYMLDLPELSIPSAAIQEAPSYYEPIMPEERTERYENATVFIHASDRDRSTSNWAGTVHGIIGHRVRFTLGENVNPRDLHGHIRVTATILVTSRYVSSKKQYEPKSVEILSVRQ